MAPRAAAPAPPEDDELVPPPASAEEESEGDTGAFGENELPELADDDPLDDAAAALGDDGMDVDDTGDLTRDEVDDAGADASVFAEDLGFAPFALGAELEEPGVGFDAIDVDDGLRLDEGFDRGEEGPSEADDDLRAEDLPALDADEDGDVAEAALYEPTLFVGLPRPETYPWADRAWEVTRLAEGSYAVASRGPTSAFFLGASGLLEVPEVGAPQLRGRGLPGAPGSLAVSWGDGAVIAGGAAVHRLAEGAWLRFADGPLQVVGTSAGVFALGRKGALLRLTGEGFVPAESARPSRRDLSAEEARLWVHTLGVAADQELLAIVLDEGTGDLVLERGGAARVALRGLSDDPAPTAVFAQGSALVVARDGADPLVAWATEDELLPLTGGRRASGLTLFREGESTVVVTAHADESRITLLRHAEHVSPSVVAVLEPRVEPDDDLASAKVALLAAGDRLLVGTAFGVFVVRPPQRAG